MPSRTVSFTDFRRNASSILDEVEDGTVVRIVRHGRVVAEIASPGPDRAAPAWKAKGLRLATRGATLSDAILADRSSAR
ncbi:MAG: type II toxin-antitoxin system Phd/YefM family antitoxin [Deltaproteobacteria bacterium]|nr:type II toxin-antitoxin system Phd/YefM family antitoxin [Deltaproteobacteria bacterium]